MPELTQLQWLRVRGVISEALARPPAEREAFVRMAMSDDHRAVNYATRLIRILESRHDVGDILDRPVAESAGEFVSEATQVSNPKSQGSSRVGMKLKSFRLAAQIGAGGMGNVYLANREDGEFEQVVALKVLKKGLATDEVIARFEGERRILANLEHPNIARLLDGGVTPDGCPYYTMDYVDGHPITDYCDRLRLSVDERLRLFLMACDAVEYAHEHHVVHRDLKPSNLFVTNEGHVKLLDFGISKLLEEEEGDRTLTVTRRFTPAYAAPEQVLGGSVTVATDVYSLGLILFELLTGHLPFEQQGDSPGRDLARLLIEPERPSSAIRSQDLDVTRARKITTSELRRRLRGDLDTIAVKTIATLPANRYGSVVELRNDVDAFLNQRPIQARAPTVAYRAKKYVQRNRALVIVSVLVTLAAGLAFGAFLHESAFLDRTAMNWGVFYPVRPPVSVPEGFMIDIAYDDIAFPDGIVAMSDEELLVVKEAPVLTKGVYRARIGSRWHPEDRIDQGDGEWQSPDDMILARDGNLYIADGQGGRVIRLALDGGSVSSFADAVSTTPDGFAPFGLAVAPEGFDGPNVSPSDIIVGSGGHLPALWAFKVQTGEATRLASGNLLGPAFSPDGTLYVTTPPSAINIVTPSGDVIPFLTELDYDYLHIAVHPVTGDLYVAKIRGQIHRIRMSDGSEEIFADGVGWSSDMEFNRRGTSLFVSTGSRQQVMEISAPIEYW